MTPTQTMHKCSQENPPLQMTYILASKFNPPKKGSNLKWLELARSFANHHPTETTNHLKMVGFRVPGSG